MMSDKFELSPPGWISWTRRASQSRRLRPKSFRPKTQLDSTEVKEIDSTREKKEKQNFGQDGGLENNSPFVA